MNILYLCDEYPPGRHGGIGTAVQLLARELVKEGHCVIVAGFYHWGYGGEDQFIDQGVKVYRFRRQLSSKLLSQQDLLHVRGLYRLLTNTGAFSADVKKSLINYRFFLENLIAEYHIDLVEMPDYNDYMRFFSCYVPFPKLSRPTVVKMHGGMTYIARGNNSEVKPYVWQMEHDLLMQAKAVSSVSKYNAEKTSEYLSYNRPVKVLYNGIDTNIMPKDILKVKNRVIYTGSLDKNKGVYELIQAWNIVAKAIPDAELWLFGKGAIKKITKLINKKILNSVFFKGHVPRAKLFLELAKASVAVFPSFAESFAMAPMEAMACGTAVIYTKFTSGPELIRDRIDGLLIDPQNITDIADKILLLLNDNGLNEKLAKSGKQRVKSNFDIGKVAQNNIEYYFSILK